MSACLKFELDEVIHLVNVKQIERHFGSFEKSKDQADGSTNIIPFNKKKK